mgnify:CR=1 FL=1
MFTKKNIPNLYYLFLFLHLFLWTIVPSVSNVNLPLDTIEALAWGSELKWGYDKHPPLSAFIVQLFYFTFGSLDWTYYLLSQIFVIFSFVYVWKLSIEIFQDKIFSFISLIVLESIYFFNYTTPEFNVNICQLPFWALTVFYFWKGLETNKLKHWALFGIFSSLGLLSKYLFIYLLISTLIFLIINFKKNKKYFKNYFISILISFLITLPHFFWLIQNDFSTIVYALNRSNLIEVDLINHLINPLKFLLKQFGILVPLFIMFMFLTSKFNLKINKDKKTTFLIIICFAPVLLMLVTSIVTGAQIRTMWMTPFYLFFGTLFTLILKKNIIFDNLKKFSILFLIFFFASPIIYLTVSLVDNSKRTDYPGKEISRLVQNKWDENFRNEIKIVVGDEWYAGNLSYHLDSRPKWTSNLSKLNKNKKDEDGVIYTGNPQILKKICPGEFGTIKPVGYCMIGVR